MKKLALLMLPVFASGCSVFGKGGGASVDQTVPLESLLPEIREVLRDIEDAALAADNKPPKATLKLETVWTGELTGSAGFLVVTSEFNRARTKTNKLSLDFTLRKSQRKSLTPEVGAALARAVVASACAVAGDENSDQTNLTKVTSSVGFEIEKSASGGLGFTIEPFELGTTYSNTNSSAQEIAITFEPADDLRARCDALVAG